VEAEPAWVHLVTIGGDIAYGRPDWITQLAPTTSYEEQQAWGNDVLIDTSYRARANSTTPPPRLSQIRANLLARYPQTGPIFA
jgi:5-methylthioadenosine/S-adenosylhomocysteine deaminase